MDEIQNNKTGNEKRPTERRVFRWECQEVELNAVSMGASDFSERIARVANELYGLIQQLHGPVEAAFDPLIHPGETANPARVLTRRKGAPKGVISWRRFAKRREVFPRRRSS